MPHLHTLCSLSSFFRYTTYISLWLSVNAPKKQMRIWQVGKKTLYNIEYSVSQFNITIKMLPVQCSQGPYEHHLRSWAGLHWIFCQPCWSPPLKRQYWWFCSGSWDCLSHSCIRFDFDIQAHKKIIYYLDIRWEYIMMETFCWKCFNIPISFSSNVTFTGVKRARRYIRRPRYSSPVQSIIQYSSF